jgi:two-component system sensor histidine kinase/response regulator
MSEGKERVASAILRARADLEEALSELEQVPAFDQSYVAFGAHALNNYLTVVAATSEFLLLSLLDHPDPQVRTWLEALQHATNLMIHTVNQMMTASATTDAKLRFVHVNVPLLVQRASTYYQRVAERKRMPIIFSSTADALFVWTDPVAVAAVLDNLLSNAVKYSAPGQRIWVHVASEAAGAVCSVRDEGPGLSQEDQVRLFQRGVRLTPQPTGGEPSSGFGLAVAKELIEKLGGAIWCKSELGQGACFSFRLPAHQEQGHGPEHILPGPPPGSKNIG